MKYNMVLASAFAGAVIALPQQFKPAQVDSAPAPALVGPPVGAVSGTPHHADTAAAQAAANAPVSPGVSKRWNDYNSWNDYGNDYGNSESSCSSSSSSSSSSYGNGSSSSSSSSSSSGSDCDSSSSSSSNTGNKGNNKPPSYHTTTKKAPSYTTTKKPSPPAYTPPSYTTSKKPSPPAYTPPSYTTSKKPSPPAYTPPSYTTTKKPSPPAYTPPSYTTTKKPSPPAYTTTTKATHQSPPSYTTTSKPSPPAYTTTKATKPTTPATYSSPATTPATSGPATYSTPATSGPASSGPATYSTPMSSGPASSGPATYSTPASYSTPATYSTPMSSMSSGPATYPPSSTTMLTSSTTTSSETACPTQPEEGTYCGFINPEDPCAPQPDGYGPHVSPDTPEAFEAYQEFHDDANNAVTPAGYDQTFKDLDAATSGNSYITFYTLHSYDVAECASKCDNTDLCTAFNIYVERDPSQNPSNNDSTAPTVYGYYCPNPASITNYKCSLWGSSIDASSATNTGEKREDFEVVIAGSNGYDKTAYTTPPPPPHYGNPQKCHGGAVNHGGDHYMGSHFFPGPYDTSMCGAYADSQTAENKKAAEQAGESTYATVNQFNAYMVHKAGRPEGIYCSLFAGNVSPSDADYTGEGDYTIDESYIYNLDGYSS